MSTQAKVWAGAAAGALAALTLFLLADRWVFHRSATVRFEADPAAVGRRMEESRATIARINATSLALLVEQYKLNSDAWPKSLDELTAPQPRGGAALCAPDKLLDPWGGRFRMEVSGGSVRVFTTSPSGESISSDPR